jgi:putative endonuclease
VAHRYDHRRLGAYGEERVLRWYLERGYEPVERNWRCREGEIDLIVARDATIVFCEVKTRSTSRFGTPQEAVGRDKQRRLRRLAAIWLRARAETEDAPFRPTGRPNLRFDVAAVAGGRVRVIEAAF